MRESGDSFAIYYRLNDSLERELAYLNAAFEAMGRTAPENGTPWILTLPSPGGKVLYRTEIGSTRIERSGDGGATWDVDWEIPQGRYDYMKRHLHRGSRWRGFGVNDIELAPDGSGALIVAFDGEGILVRSPDGEWSQHAIDGIVPVTSSARSASDVGSALMFEWFVLIALGLIAGITLNEAGWEAIPRTGSEDLEKSRPRTARRVFSLVVIIILTIFGTSMTAPILGPAVPLFFFGPASLIFGFLILSDWANMSAASQGDPGAMRILRTCIVGTIAAWLAPTLVMILWTLGVVIAYWAAATVALLLWIASLAVPIIAIRKNDPAEPGIA